MPSGLPAVDLVRHRAQHRLEAAQVLSQPLAPRHDPRTRRMAVRLQAGELGDHALGLGHQLAEVLPHAGPLDGPHHRARAGDPVGHLFGDRPVGQRVDGEIHAFILTRRRPEREGGRQPWALRRAARAAAPRARPSATRRSVPLASSSARTRSNVSWSSSRGPSCFGAGAARGAAVAGAAAAAQERRSAAGAAQPRPRPLLPGPQPVRHRRPGVRRSAAGVRRGPGCGSGGRVQRHGGGSAPPGGPAAGRAARPGPHPDRTAGRTADTP